MESNKLLNTLVDRFAKAPALNKKKLPVPDWVTPEWIAGEIAFELQKIPHKILSLPFTKMIADNTGLCWHEEKLTSTDIKYLLSIWGEMPKLSCRQDEFENSFKRIFDDSLNKPTWNLHVNYKDDSLVIDARNIWFDIREVQLKRVDEAIRNGTLKAFNADTSVAAKLGPGIRILLEDARIFLAQDVFRGAIKATNGNLNDADVSSTKIIRNKLRVNSLDVPIDKAIAIANSLDTSAVWLVLREIALASESPFTGAIDGDGLCYTNDSNETLVNGKTVKLTRDALRKRLGRRSLSADSGR